MNNVTQPAISKSEDEHATPNNCYKKCDKYYYFKSSNEYYCVDECPTGYKSISEKKKCIDNCSKDSTYKLTNGNTCVSVCPTGTVNIDNICKPCYESCGSCSAVGTENDHKCNLCKSGYEKLNNNKDNNCYPKCNHYYYFNESSL